MFLTALTFFCANCSYFDDWEKTQRVTPLVNKVLMSQCFSREARNVGMSERWLSLITTAKRRVDVIYYFEDTSTIGYTIPDVNKNIYVNKKFHDSYNLCQTGSNLAHEVLHLEGFRHFGVTGVQEQEFAGWDDAYKVNAAFDACCVEP
jgi:hypothetical protein